jgi:hypothetical protein
MARGLAEVKAGEKRPDGPLTITPVAQSRVIVRPPGVSRGGFYA